MDVIKQKRNLILVIILLVIFNLATLFLLWFGNPSRQAGHFNVEKNTEKIQQLLKKELGFNDEQTEKYLQLRTEHQQESIKLNRELNLVKKEMFDKILEDNESNSLSDSLLSLTLEKQSQIEKLTFNHFLSLKELCNPEQQKNLKYLMHGIFGPPPPGGKPDGPPTGEMREGFPPLPPKGNLDGKPKGEMREGHPPPPPMRN